jgi:hypothetical protein
MWIEQIAIFFRSLRYSNQKLLPYLNRLSQFQKSVASEIGFAFAPVSLKPYANAAIKGRSFKTRPTFERTSIMYIYLGYPTKNDKQQNVSTQKIRVEIFVKAI